MDAMENVERVHPLTPAQRGLLYQTLLGDPGALYRTQSRDRVLGAFDVGTFRAAVEWLVARHESLRCLFLHVGLDEPAAVVRREVELPWAEHDLGALDEEARRAALDEIARASLETPLPLDRAPLFRVTVSRLSDECSEVVFDIHHLIFDGWSSALFFAELQHVYAALRDGRAPHLPPAGRFGDHAERVAASDASGAAARWAERLRGFERPTSLQLDRALAHDVQDALHTDASRSFELDERVTARLHELARTARVTVATVVEAAWALTLARYNDTADVVVGITLNGRGAAGGAHERTFGMFVNAFPLRLRCAPDTSVRAWLDAAGREKARLVEDENASLADVHLASELPAGVPLFEALLVFQTFPALGGGGEAPLHFANVAVHENSPLPLLIDVFDGERLRFTALHTSERLAAAAVDRLVGHYLEVLRSLAAIRSPEAVPLAEVRMLTEADRELLLGRWGAPALPADASGSLHGAFLERARRTPEAVAVRDARGATSYLELDRKSVV